MNWHNRSLFEPICMSFSAICYFACGTLGINYRMPGVSFIIGSGLVTLGNLPQEDSGIAAAGQFEA